MTLFSYHLTSYNTDYLKSLELPIYMASYNKSNITADKIFTTDTLVLITGFKTNGLNVIQEDERQNIEREYGHELNNKLVIWGDSYFHNALIFNFKCVEILKYGNGYHVYRLEKNLTDGEITTVKFSPDYLLSLDFLGVHKCSRRTIYGLEGYDSLIVKLNYISGFEYFPDYSTCCIYSPFSEKGQIAKLMNDINGKNENEILGYLHKHINDYIPPYMMKIIKEYNINDRVTEEQIIEGYISLICDFLHVKKKSLKENNENNKDNS